MEEMRTKKTSEVKNSCGKKGCYISVRVMPYGEYDRKKYRRQIERTVKALRNLAQTGVGG